MSRKGYTKRSRPGKEREAAGLTSDVPLPLCREELVALMQESLSSFATEMGLRIAAQLLEEEVTQRCGPRYAHQADRELFRHGRQPGYVTLAGQKLPVPKPRLRRAGGQGEVELATYELLQRGEP